MSENRPLLGIVLMLGFCVLAPLGDSFAKILGTTWPLAVLVLVRFVAQAALVVPIMAATGRFRRFDGATWRLMGLRSALQVAGLATMFLALQYLPVADAIAILYVMPFLLLLFGKMFLGEAVGPHRIAACIVGFAGTLLVVQPNFLAVGLPALLPMAVAAIFTAFMLVTRHLAQRVDAITLQGLGGLIAIPMCLPGLWLMTGAVPDRILPADWLLLALLGATGTLSHLLMTWGLRFAPATTLAPMQYLEIPVATVVGFALFGDLPNGVAAAGIAVTMAAGLYVVAREQRLSRRPAPTPPRGTAVPPSAG